MFCVAHLSVLVLSCLSHQNCLLQHRRQRLLLQPSGNWGDKDVRGDDSSQIPRHACLCCGVRWVIRLQLSYDICVVILFSRVYPGKRATPGSAWKTTATPPTPDHRGEGWRRLWEDEEGGGERGGATKDSGLTAGDSARSSATGLHYSSI